LGPGRDASALAYGAALNEGRAMFASDELFGDWLVSSKLRLSENDRMERAAAMWAAANPDQSLRNATPGPFPFSGRKTTPAASSAARMAATASPDALTAP